MKASPWILEVLWKLINLLLQQIQALQQEVKDVTDRLKATEEELHRVKAILAQNSKNSSKPPSSDKNKKSKPTSLRPKGQKKSGGQPGHPGSRLIKTDNPDEIVTHRVDECSGCHASLEDVEAQSHTTRQVYDLEVKIKVTEHSAEKKVCPHCRTKNEADFPENVTQDAQYGTGFRAFVTYCNVQQFIPLNRICEMIQDLTGHSVSEGSIVNTNKRVADMLEPFQERVTEALLQQPVVNFDETGCNVNGKNHWVHSASTEHLTYYQVHQRRGQVAMDDVGILPRFTGNAVHDHWPSYFKYDDCSHSMCNAHHVRELTGILENDNQAWAGAMINLLYAIKKEVDEAKELGLNKLPDARITDYEQQYAAILAQGLSENPSLPSSDESKPGRKKQSKAKNLLDRLEKRSQETLGFMYDFRVPFTNNQAEQDVRMMKVQQKVSGLFRSFTGAETFCKIRSYISTLRKNSLPILEYIERAVKGEPFLPG